MTFEVTGFSGAANVVVVAAPEAAASGPGAALWWALLHAVLRATLAMIVGTHRRTVLRRSRA
jgi:hypothetical protein